MKVFKTEVRAQGQLGALMKLYFFIKRNIPKTPFLSGIETQFSGCPPFTTFPQRLQIPIELCNIQFYIKQLNMMFPATRTVYKVSGSIDDIVCP
jgi:hypothetical protein